ncbi:MAG TPA: tetratricopeptide repeat protein [Candidatus Obscuribacterales bacterium]
MAKIGYLCLSALICVGAAGCSSNLSVRSGGLSDVKIGKLASPTQPAAGVAQLVEPIDMEAEEVVSKGCVEAWRKAVAGDQAGAMRQLEDLNERYPKVVTIQFMMGQVLERGGKKQEAVKHYRAAVKDSRFNMMYLFKLAESLRTTGDAKGAAQNYRELLAVNPDFAPARLGLARALFMLDKDSSEARQEAERALALDPSSKETREFMAELAAVRH